MKTIEVLTEAIHKRAVAVEGAIRMITDSRNDFIRVARPIEFISKRLDDKVSLQEKKVLGELFKLSKMYEKQNIKALKYLKKIELDYIIHDKI
jgi:hypothetical protein